MSDTQATSRNIIICSDGTGNAGGRTKGTNVWRIYKELDRHDSKIEQLAYYDDGVGTDNLRFLKIIGGAFGWGLSRNLIDLYSFAASHYRPGDRLYLFGFSRGAYTVRALGEMILKCGLLKSDRYRTERQPRRLVKQILRAYQREGDEKVAELRQRYPDGFHKDIEIEFIGVWDTVDAVGVPLDELRRPLDWLSRKILKRRLYGFSKRKELDQRVKYGYQALSIDDERKTFHPNLWHPRQDGNGEIEQVWFAGAHSNVGGGYPQDGMSYVTLDWMMEKATDCGLVFNPTAPKEVRLSADVHAKLYDARTGLGMFYCYAPRDLGEEPKIHVSVNDRIQRGTGRYAPIVIPHDASCAVNKDGPYSSKPDQPLPTFSRDKVAYISSLIGWRKRLYTIFAAFSTLVAAMVVIGLLRSEVAVEPVWPAWLQGFFKLLVPGALERLVDLAAQYPQLTAAAAVILVSLRIASTRLTEAIKDAAFKAWRREGAPSLDEQAAQREESDQQPSSAA